ASRSSWTARGTWSWRAAMNDALKRIHMQVMWNRLIAVVEEQAQALLHTAFGAITREAGDLSAGVYDTGGRMLAQAVTGTPGHVNTMAAAVRHFLDRYPIEARGDLLSLIACNDVGAARLADMMREFDLDSIDELARHILDTSREATREAIRRVPRGSYRTAMTLDGYESPIELRARLDI